MKLSSEQARIRLAANVHGVLATLHPDRGPDPQPVVYAVSDDDHVGVPIDRVKPKASSRLQREDNLEADPRGALLIEGWDIDDWSRLWWVRADLEHVNDPPSPLVEDLANRLASTVPQYADKPFHRVLVSRIVRVTGWSASAPCSSWAVASSCRRGRLESVKRGDLRSIPRAEAVGDGRPQVGKGDNVVPGSRRCIVEAPQPWCPVLRRGARLVLSDHRPIRGPHHAGRAGPRAVGHEGAADALCEPQDLRHRVGGKARKVGRNSCHPYPQPPRGSPPSLPAADRSPRPGAGAPAAPAGIARLPGRP